MFMKNKIYIIIFIILIVAGSGFLIWQNVKNSQASSELIAFAKCLSEKGATMYGTESCEWCQRQRVDFKNAWQYINYVDCFKEPQKCVAQNIEAMPTWIFPSTSSGQAGQKLTGYQELKGLAQQSGCVLH